MSYLEFSIRIVTWGYRYPT